MGWLTTKRNEARAPSLDELRALTLRLEKVLHELGLTKVRAFRTPEMPYLLRASDKERRRYELLLRPYVEVLEEMAASGENPRESRLLFWRMTRKLELVPRSDIIDKIEPEDIVEIYDRKNRQIFRNLTFFAYVDATLEEVIGADWSKVTKRDLRLTFRMFAQVATVVSGRLKDTLDLQPDWPEHRMDTPITGQSFFMKFRYISPVLREGKPAGFVIVHRTRFAD